VTVLFIASVLTISITLLGQDSKSQVYIKLSENLSEMTTNKSRIPYTSVKRT